MNDWQSASEIVFGAILEGDVSPNKVKAHLLVEPYDKGIALLVEGRDVEYLSVALGFMHIVTARQAYNKVRGSISEVDVVASLERTYHLNQMGTALSRASKQMLRGETPTNALDMIEGLKQIENPQSIGLTPASEISENYDGMMLSGWEALDENLGGIPRSGILLLGADTGLGKSFFSMKLAGKFHKQYPNKIIAIYSLEMPKEQYMARGMKMYPEFRDACAADKIHISDEIVTIHDIGVECAASNVGMIIVDYIDYLVPGQLSESAYAEIYIKTNSIARSLQIPFVMIAQLNRTQHTDKIPRKWQFRYSGMAENTASMILCLARFNSADDVNGEFKFFENSLYVIAWKHRNGWLYEQNKGGPGAIVLNQTKNLWDDTGIWVRHGDVIKMTRGTK